MPILSDFTATAADGTPVPLSRYANHVALIVNTASRCGFTPQYAGLQALQEAYAPQGLAILAFPCNQFGAQEPGTDAEIAAFCTTSYDTGFPIFARIDVNGPAAPPLFAWLRSAAPGLLGSTAIKWNFTKFLLARDGTPIARYAPTRTPDSLRPQIEAALEE